MNPWPLRSRSFAAGMLLAMLACALSLPPARMLIEQSMLWHMAVQMPMLVAAGSLLMRSAPTAGLLDRFTGWNAFGLTGFIAAQGIIAYWMLPLAIDRAVVLPATDVLKIVSLLACGALLARAFARSVAVVQLFFLGYAVSMLGSLGLYLLGTNRRLCNAYSLESQFSAGVSMLILASALAIAWTGFTLRRREGSRGPEQGAVASRAIEVTALCDLQRDTGNRPASPCPLVSVPLADALHPRAKIAEGVGKAQDLRLEPGGVDSGVQA